MYSENILTARIMACNEVPRIYVGVIYHESIRQFLDNFLKIKFTDELSLKHGDFNAEVKDGFLHLPAEMEVAIKSWMIAARAEHLMGVLWGSPTDVAKTLGWNRKRSGARTGATYYCA